MRNANGKSKTWVSAAKESFLAYIRTLVVIWQSGPLAVLGMMFLTLSLGVVPACQFFVTEHLVNAITAAVGDPNWWRQVLPWLIGLLGLRILSVTVDLFREPLYIHLGENIEIWINEGVARKVNTTELIELQTGEFQNALERARSVSGLALQEILWYFVDSVQQLISIATLGVVLWRYHPLLALLPALTGLASWWSDSRFSADLYDFDVQQTPQRREQDALEGTLTDRGTGKEVRLYQAQDVWIDRWHRLGQALIDGQMGIRRRKFSVCLSLDITRGLLYACSLILLLFEVFRGDLTVGTYIAAAAALVQLDGIWNEIAGRFQGMVDVMRPLFGDLYQFLDRKVTRVAQGDPDARDASINELNQNRTVQDIGIENLSFFYPNTQEPTLNDITLTFKKGERVALVGPNGAGKTTLARLLLGLYRPAHRCNSCRRGSTH